MCDAMPPPACNQAGHAPSSNTSCHSATAPCAGSEPEYYFMESRIPPVMLPSWIYFREWAKTAARREGQDTRQDGQQQGQQQEDGQGRPGSAHRGELEAI